MTTLAIESITVETLPDEDADLSYLTQDYADVADLAERAEYVRQDAERLAGYGDSWSCVGVRVVARVRVAGVSQTICSGGLWGVEDDSGGEYVEEVAGEQLDELREMLVALGFAAEDIAAAIAADADAARAQLRAESCGDSVRCAPRTPLMRSSPDADTQSMKTNESQHTVWELAQRNVDDRLEWSLATISAPVAAAKWSGDGKPYYGVPGAQRSA